MKKNIIFIIFLIIVLLMVSILFITLNNNKNKKFYLNNEYYNNHGYVEISSKQVEKLLKDKKSFILFTYNNFCSFSKPCDVVFENVSKDKSVSILEVPFDEFKKTSLYKTVEYAPSIIIIHNGKIVDYLDAESDDDVVLYQDESKFYDWLKKYIYVKKKMK